MAIPPRAYRKKEMAGEPPAEGQGSTPGLDEWEEPPLGPASPSAAARGSGENVPAGPSPVREPQTPLRVRNLFGQGTTPSPDGTGFGQTSAQGEGDVGKAVLMLAEVQKQLLSHQQDKKPFETQPQRSTECGGS